MEITPETIAAEVKSSVAEVKNDMATVQASVDALRTEVKNANFAVAAAAPKTLVKLVEEKTELKSFQRGDRAVEFKAPADMLRANIGDSQTFITAGPLVQAPARPTHVRDYLNIGRISTGKYVYDREKLATNNAGVVAEGARKPQSSITYEQVEVTETKIAHFFKLSTELLKDAPAFAYAIQKRGIEMLLTKEDYILLHGPNGLFTQATAFNANGLVVERPQALDVARAGMMQIRKALYTATVMFVSPEQAAQFELLKDANGNYLTASMYNGSAVNAVAGMQIVGIDELVGDEFLIMSNQAVDAFQVEDIAVRVSDSNEDDFVNNKVTILEEERLIWAVTRPAALVKGNFGAAIGAITAGANNL